jgi:hypothetical protein
MKAKDQRVGRNDPCPCGSGRKHKHCCEGKAGKASPGQRLLLVAIAAAVAGGLYLTVSSRVEPGARTTGVWSAEHGHYH